MSKGVPPIWQTRNNRRTPVPSIEGLTVVTRLEVAMNTGQAYLNHWFNSAARSRVLPPGHLRDFMHNYEAPIIEDVAAADTMICLSFGSYMKFIPRFSLATDVVYPYDSTIKSMDLGRLLAS
jgi:hypothetical protein